MAEPTPQQPAHVRPTNGMAVASLVLSICGVVFTLPLIGSVLGIIFGFVAKEQIKKSKEQGDGMALAGILIGGIPLVLGILAILGFLVIAVIAAAFSSSIGE